MKESGLFFYKEIATPCIYHDYCYISRPAGTLIKKHQHDFYQFIHVIDGCLQIETDSGLETLTSGHVHVLPPSHTHTLLSENGYTQFGLNLRPNTEERDWLKRFEKYFPLPSFFSCPLPAALQQKIDKQPSIMDELEELCMINILDDYCINILTAKEQDKHDLLKKKLLRYFELNCTKPLSVEDIAGELSMSRASLQRVCASIFGCGARTLFERIRIENAAKYLRQQSEASINDCAIHFGYSDIYIFSKSFKRIKNISPLKFRNGE